MEFISQNMCISINFCRRGVAIGQLVNKKRAEWRPTKRLVVIPLNEAQLDQLGLPGSSSPQVSGP